MRCSIPLRLPNEDIPRLDIGVAWSLDFEPLQKDRYPCFDLAIAAGREGGTAPTALSAADEVAVESFLQGRIGFTDIYRVVEKVLGENQKHQDADLEAVVDVDRWASARAGEIAERLAR